MSKLEDLYKKKSKEIESDKIGAGVKDFTPYSLGNGPAGSKNIDEPAITKLEAKRGKRYSMGDLGGGSKFSPGFTATNKYSDSVKK